MDLEENNRSLEKIFEEFMLTLDDAIGTFKATKKENKRVNQLLFSYIVNNFDSAISDWILNKRVDTSTKNNFFNY